MADPRKYEFNWNLLGDINLGRPNLGKYARLEVYRLMQFTLRDVIEERLGTAAADEIFFAAGYKAGIAYYDEILGEIKDFNEFIRRLQESLQEMQIGILHVEMADLEKGSFILTVSEDLDCSGLPEMDTEICVYDEGFISGLLEKFAHIPFDVKEIDCWCSGDRTCRFSAKVRQG